MLNIVRHWDGFSEAMNIPGLSLQVEDGRTGRNTISLYGRAGMTINRDRVLTEKIIRGCWHEWPEGPSSRLEYRSDLCKKCGGLRGDVFYIDFSSWNGFGELWGQLRQREYWGEFWNWLTQKYSWDEWESKPPNQRADVVYEFWKEKGKKSY